MIGCGTPSPTGHGSRPSTRMQATRPGAGGGQVEGQYAGAPVARMPEDYRLPWGSTSGWRSSWARRTWCSGSRGPIRWPRAAGPLLVGMDVQILQLLRALFLGADRAQHDRRATRCGVGVTSSRRKICAREQDAEEEGATSGSPWGTSKRRGTVWWRASGPRGASPRGPVFVFHHTKRDVQVLQKKLLLRSRAEKHAKDPLFRRFNRSKANGAWPLVQARLGPERLEELVRGGPKPGAEQHALATRMLAYPSYVVQRFEGLDQVFEACCSIFKVGGRFAFCEGPELTGGAASAATWCSSTTITWTSTRSRKTWSRSGRRPGRTTPIPIWTPLLSMTTSTRRDGSAAWTSRTPGVPRVGRTPQGARGAGAPARREAGLVDWTELERASNKWTQLTHDVCAALGDQQGPLFVAHCSHYDDGLWQTTICRWPDGRRRWTSPDEPSRAGVPRPPFQDFNDAADNKAWPLVEAGLFDNLIGDLLPELPEGYRLPWEQHERLAISWARRTWCSGSRGRIRWPRQLGPVRRRGVQPLRFSRPTILGADRAQYDRRATRFGGGLRRGLLWFRLHCEDTGFVSQARRVADIVDVAPIHRPGPNRSCDAGIGERPRTGS